MAKSRLWETFILNPTFSPPSIHFISHSKGEQTQQQNKQMGVQKQKENQEAGSIGSPMLRKDPSTLTTLKKHTPNSKT